MMLIFFQTFCEVPAHGVHVYYRTHADGLRIGRGNQALETTRYDENAAIGIKAFQNGIGLLCVDGIFSSPQLQMSQRCCRAVNNESCTMRELAHQHTKDQYHFVQLNSHKTLCLSGFLANPPKNWQNRRRQSLRDRIDLQLLRIKTIHQSA